MLILLSAIWGSAFFAIKICVESIHPISVASLRLIIGAIILFIYFKIKKIKIKLTYNNLFILFIIGLLGNFIPFSLISWSEIYVKSNTAGLLLSVAPILTLIFSHFMTKDDKFTFIKLISIVIGLFGVSLIFGINTLTEISSDPFRNFFPKFAIVIAALGYVLSSIIAYNFKNIDSVTMTTFVTIFAAIISVPFLLYAEYSYRSNFTLSSTLPLIYLGIFPTAIAFLIRFYIISKAGPIFLSYVAYLIPLFAIIWGYVFLNESIDLTTSIGVLLILLGVFVSRLKSMNKITN